MRNLVSLLLIGLIAACPIFCMAAGFGQDAHQCRPDSTCGDHGVPDPSPCSDDAGSCICSGAIQAADVRLADSHATALPTSIFLALPAPGLRPSPFRHLTCDGEATGLASFGDSGAVRALLQNYRC